ncbi:MAG: AI-2E family transporter [Cellvibrionaceae bacterium]
MLNILRGWVDRYFGDEESVLLAVILVLGLVVVVTMGAVLAPAIAGLIIAFLLQGLVNRLKSWGLPHWFSVSVTTFILVTLLALSFFYLMPVVWQQMIRLVGEVPGMLTEGQRILSLLPEQYPQLITEAQIHEIVDSAGRELGAIGQNVLSFSVSSLPLVAGVLVYLILVPILVFFFLKDSEKIRIWMTSFLPSERPMMSQIWHEMNDQVANYVRGKAIEIIVVGTVSYVAFATLGLNYALLLGLAVGFSVVIPYIGAAVVTLPVLMIGFFQWGIGNEFYWLFVVYSIIQALDGNVLVPLLFSEAVNLHPIAIILAVLVFGGVWGFWGVFFAIPLATLIKAIVNAWSPAHPVVAHSE